MHSCQWVSTRTRSCCDASTNHTDDDATEANESIECAICLEPMIDSMPTVNLGCTHKFHGQCLVTHMIKDVRCPLCRYDPTYTDDTDDDGDEEEEPRVSFKDALKLAKKDKKNKATVKSLATISKWKKTKKTAKTTLCCINQKLDPHEKKMKNDIELYEKKLMADFNHRFATDYLARKNSDKEIGKANAQLRAAQLRLAKKYGFRLRVGSRFRSRAWRYY